GERAHSRVRVWRIVPTRAPDAAMVRMPAMTVHQRPMSGAPMARPSAPLWKARKANTSHTMPTPSPRIRFMTGDPGSGGNDPGDDLRGGRERAESTRWWGRDKGNGGNRVSSRDVPPGDIGSGRPRKEPELVLSDE